MRLWPSFSARSAEGGGGWHPEPAVSGWRLFHLWGPHTFQDLSQWRLGLVRGGLTIFVSNADQGPAAHQVLWEQGARTVVWDLPSVPLPPCPASCPAPTHLSHLLVSPEAGIVQRRVAVLVHCIDVCLELHQLGTRDSPCEPRTVPVSPGNIPMSPGQPSSSLCLALGDAGAAHWEL